MSDTSLIRLASQALDAMAGECRIDPHDGNGFVLRSVRKRPNGQVVVQINDILGSHEHEVLLDEWLTWEASTS